MADGAISFSKFMCVWLKPVFPPFSSEAATCTSCQQCLWSPPQMVVERCWWLLLSKALVGVAFGPWRRHLFRSFVVCVGGFESLVPDDSLSSSITTTGTLSLMRFLTLRYAWVCRLSAGNSRHCLRADSMCTVSW